MLAQAVANETGLGFLSVKGSELYSKYVGESEKAIAALFKRCVTRKGLGPRVTPTNSFSGPTYFKPLSYAELALPSPRWSSLTNWTVWQALGVKTVQSSL